MIQGLHTVRIAKPGKPIRWYIYAWRGGPCIAKRTGAAEPKLTKDELAAVVEHRSAENGPAPGTILALARQWRGNGADTASVEWKALAETTRATWGLQLDLIEAKWGKSPVALWSDARMVEKVVAWRDSRAATPRSADIGITVLKALLDFGRLRGKVKVNVAENIPQLYRGGDRAEIIWTPEDIAAFLAEAPQRIGDGLRLAAVTGLRREDLLTLTWEEVGEHAIVRIAKKKSRGRQRRATVPLIPEAKTLLDELRTRHRAEGVDTVLVNTRGEPWLDTSFSMQFNKARNDAKIIEPAQPRLDKPAKKKHLHDVRGTFCTHLCRTSLTNQEIARIMAWSEDRVEGIRRVYVDDAAVVVALAKRISGAL